MRRSFSTYQYYGLDVQSAWPFPDPGSRLPTPELGTMELVEATAPLLSDPSIEAALPAEPWFQSVRLPDGAYYLRWPQLFEFLVSPDGRVVRCRRFGEASWESFHTYLLGQVLSFALLQQGLEPLHCTAVVVEGAAVGFIGHCGYGKSSLAAAFLQAGHALLTDDLLVVKEQTQGYLAYPGFPRLKLFPEIARAVLGDRISGARMNPYTPKLIIPLSREQYSAQAAPLQAIYVLRPPEVRGRGRRITIRAMNPRRAFLALTANTFNTTVRTPERLRRQFGFAIKLAASIPFKSLSYPRDLDCLPEVVAAIRKQIQPQSGNRPKPPPSIS